MATPLKSKSENLNGSLNLTGVEGKDRMVRKRSKRGPNHGIRMRKKKGEWGGGGSGPAQRGENGFFSVRVNFPG